MSVRDAILSPSEAVSVEKSLGRVLSVCTVSCPPAVPILMSGEIIDENCINAFRYYGIRDVKVVLK
jgi:arginine/lysine/ornithine decarboxylase